jgi:hypothetical protein
MTVITRSKSTKMKENDKKGWCYYMKERKNNKILQMKMDKIRDMNNDLIHTLEDIKQTFDDDDIEKYDDFEFESSKIRYIFFIFVFYLFMLLYMGLYSSK